MIRTNIPSKLYLLAMKTRKTNEIDLVRCDDSLV